MSFPTPIVLGDKVVRKISTYHPSIWGDYFIKYTHESLPYKAQISKMKERLERLKVDTIHMLQKSNNLVKIMDWIDAIQLLGLGYHFEKEIGEALQRVHDADFSNSHDLYVVALRFRLLRQQGRHVSSDVFNEFINKEGSFKGDAKGLLSLYNAAYLGVHGEIILDKAINFTKSTLTSLLSKLEQPLASQVSLALRSPFPRTIRLLLAKKYLSIYEHDATRNSAIVELAQLNCNLLQYQHREELYAISKWWKDLALIECLRYARDRVVECYYWINALFYEPQYARARLIMAKVIVLSSVMDDTFDNYSTFEESRLLNEAIQRWERSAVDLLPAYMKKFYLKMITSFEEFEDELEPENKYRVSYLINEMKVLSEHYFREAEWCAEKFVPTVQEHLRTTTVSTGYFMLTCASFVGMGAVATREAFEWVASYPKIIQASAVICRIMDDITSHKLEQERDHVASTVECYMKEHNTDEAEACERLQVLVENAWKDLNEEYLNSVDHIPIPLLDRVVNITRVLEDTHKHVDAYTNSKTTMKDHIILLFVQPIRI